MRAVLGQIAGLAAGVLAAYAIVWGLAAWAVPYHPTPLIDTMTADESFWADGPRQVVMDRRPLQSTAPKVLFMGASNCREGFRPEDLTPLLPPGTEVHNVSLGYANVHETEEVVDIALESIPASARVNTVVVACLWYGSFLSDVRNYPPSGETRVDTERLRSGLYSRIGEAITPNLPTALIPTAITLMRPYFALRPLSARLSALRHGGQVAAAENGGDKITKRELALMNGNPKDYWNQKMGDPAVYWDETQVVRLNALADRLSALGAHLVLAEMPLPTWHMRMSPYIPYYSAHKSAVRASLIGKADWVELTLPDRDDVFEGATHPSREGAKALAQQIAPTIARSLSAGRYPPAR